MRTCHLCWKRLAAKWSVSCGEPTPSPTLGCVEKGGYIGDMARIARVIAPGVPHLKPQKRGPKDPWKHKKQKVDKISIVFPKLFQMDDT
ncbi:MAG: hypothetical protein CO090_01535 [Acidobacteria bacterium CG_4_9_14_3_um_filter_49_7]|nr:MAG: hypothetical protein CO090_01535 [Acidobacteria bacterium CG_4_9_14_3_um_filter_49_7]